MILPENILKCVAFLAARKNDCEYIFLGSAFWIASESQQVSDSSTRRAERVYLVTARHVVDAIAKLHATEIYLRVNLKNGSSEWSTISVDDWLFHPTDTTIDVAILKIEIRTEWDHFAIGDSLFVTDDRIKEHAIDLGDDVFVTGLFRHHHGTLRNIPIVRVGNLASMSEEPVQTKFFGQMNAILIECRSIGGISGSPVFVNLGFSRLINGQVKNVVGGKPIFFLIGAIHGHYDVDSGKIDASVSDDGDLIGGGKINTGIAIVTPIRGIREVVEASESGC